MDSGQFRNELKYLCSGEELSVIGARLSVLMERDAHAGADGAYEVRSIYFDDPAGSAAKENEDGTSPREKWRIRAYNCDPSRISLECKKKDHGLIRKSACAISPSELEAFCAGEDGSVSYDAARPLLNRFLVEMKIRQLRPALIVRYDRTPFVWPADEIRVTFDRQISTSAETEDFFRKDMPVRPVLPGGMHLLEVKFNTFLPPHLARAMQTEDLRQTTFSKYYLSRIYDQRRRELTWM
ncbi:MAG: polyphosphate polymerase domain-containing protein [Lachnospiraceae bacterium]|nr:polyphosphate polymerase domain-containing protein [Lachnospiraceae bacterium]